MAKLADPSAPERPTPRLQREATRDQPIGPSGAQGRGIQLLGTELGAGADELFRFQKLEEERVNTLRAEDAFTQLRERQLDLSIGEDNGFAKLKGKDAVTKPILSEWGKRFQDAETEIAGSLSNDRQRQQFKVRADNARLQFNEEMLRHLAREGDAYAKEVYDGTVATEQRNAVARWDSPNDIASSIERIRYAVDERADRYGWAPEYRKAVMQSEAGKVHAAIVQQALASGNYLYAQEWFNEHKADIDLPTAKAVERAVEDGTQKQLSAGYQKEYLLGEDNSKALEDLRKRVMGDNALGEDRRNILVGRIQNRQYVLERRAEVANDREMRTLQRSLTDLNSNTLAGFEPSPEQFAPILAAAKGTELEGDVRSAIQLASATRAFRNAPTTQQEKILAEGEASIRTDPSKADRRVLSAWRSVYESQQRQIKENPVTFAVQQGIVPPPEPLDLSQPNQMGDALKERFDIARGIAAKYPGAPFKPLTEAETNLLRSAMKGAAPEQKRQYFSGIAQAAGNDYEGYSAVMAQLAPDDPVTAVAGTYAYRGRTIASDLMLKGQSILNPVRKEDGKPDQGKLWPMPPETELRKGFQSYEKDAFAGHAGARNAMYQGAVSIYAAKSADEGDASGVLNNSRWEQAIKLATGGIEKYNGKAIVLPYGYEYGQFKDGLNSRVDQILESGRLDKGMTRAKLTDMPLEAIGDGRYVFKAGDGILVDKDQRPLVVDFNVGMPFRTSGDAIDPASVQRPPLGGKVNGDKVRNPTPGQLVRPSSAGVRG